MSDPVTRARWARIRIIAFWWFAAFILAASLMPAPHVPTTGLSDKLAHMLAYLLLSGLGLYAYPRHASVVLAGVFGLGVGIEVLQYFTATRSFEMLDIAANGAGVLLGAGVVYLARRA